MVKLVNERYRNSYKSIYEDTDLDAEDIHTPEYINKKLKEIAKDNGYLYKEYSINTLGSGEICISKNVYITIKYNDVLTSISTKIMKSVFSCLDTVKEVDDLSMDLQTAQMIIDAIRMKLI